MVQVILNCKGFQAIQTHRVAHSLWCRGKRVMALALQSRSSEVFAVDIHPGARIGEWNCAALLRPDLKLVLQAFRQGGPAAE